MAEDSIPRRSFLKGAGAAGAAAATVLTAPPQTAQAWSAKAITEQYLKAPGPLVHA
jgi:hypothetical protein